MTLMDDRLVTEEDLLANFLIRPDENEFSGRCLAELCCDSLREFNPMVRVSVEKGKSCCKLLYTFILNIFQKNVQNKE